ncbi:PH domain-like protein [Annulohypoxylon maeteangense]|uniref:PH domain-like protein n=1 Tax=Annulohypoxylon maeteangense TaxID=1927788 RepID=UPI0020087467|nr:PH domain-like protein [Annulohypoxylon maeteangense]KAI0884209.1 PH domain-like protein [Annulohypoxylon maeteangense]
MSQTAPRKYRGHQSQSSYSQSQSRSPHSHAHTHSHTHNHPQQQYQQQYTYQQNNPSSRSQGHARNRSHQLRAEYSEQGGTTTGSDYDSDMATYVPDTTIRAPVNLATRTNTELNMAVLRRYRPSITSILSIAANAVVYSFGTKWDKANLEGTLFVCSQEPASPPTIPQTQAQAALSNGCVFILNRKGLSNLVVDLSDVERVELSNETLIFKLDKEPAVLPMENGESIRTKALGMFIYFESAKEREITETLVHEMWQQSRATARENAGPDASDAEPANSEEEAEMAQSMQEAGRQLSVTELFGRSQNNGAGLGGY